MNTNTSKPGIKITSPGPPGNNESTLSISPVKFLENNSNNNNSNNNNVREVNTYVSTPEIDPRLFLTPGDTYMDLLKQAVAMSIAKAARDEPLAALFVEKASHDIMQQVKVILNNQSLDRASKIEQTNDIIKNLFQYTFFKGLRNRKHALVFLDTILDIITERKDVLGRVEGDRRMRHDIEKWIDYASGRRTHPPSGLRKSNTRRAGKGGRRTQKKKNW